MPIFFQQFFGKCYWRRLSYSDGRFWDARFFSVALSKKAMLILNLKSKAWPFKYKREGILFSGTILFVMQENAFISLLQWVELY